MGAGSTCRAPASRSGEIDPFAVEVMDEIGIDISRHRSRSFDQLDDDYFDLVISLSPEAQHRAVELTRHSHCDLEFWHMPDPSMVEGARETQAGGLSGLTRHADAAHSTAVPRRSDLASIASKLEIVTGC